MKNQGDNLFAQIRYGFDVEVSQANFVTNFILSKIDFKENNCHCLDKENINKINNYSNVLWKK